MEDYIVKLLHADKENSNKLVDLKGASGAPAFVLYKEGGSSAHDMFEEIKERYGKTGTTALRGSAVNGNDQILGRRNVFDWKEIGGEKRPTVLHSFIKDVYKEIKLKGNNPLFLGLGAIRWDIISKTAFSQDKKEIISPLIIFPIRLIRSGENQTVSIEFVEDDVHFNTCFYYRLKSCFETVAKNFPLPSENVDDPIDIFSFDLEEYFNRVERFVAESKLSDVDGTTTFELLKNFVAVSVYKHEDFCMYYDIKRNFDKLVNNPLAKLIFEKNDKAFPEVNRNISSSVILPCDVPQEEMISKAVNGANFIIQGPPGSGKTHTIDNMIAALIGAGKRVLFVSQKMAALSEVYNKMPEKIQKFILPLYCESEQDAAKFNPSKIQAELKKTLTAGETDTQAEMKYGLALQKKNEEQIKLAAYCKDMFTSKAYIGGNLYDALDVYFKNEEIKPVEFLKFGDSLSIAREEYLRAKDSVAEANGYYDILSDGENHTVLVNPWCNLKQPVNFTEIKTAAEKFNGNLLNFAEEFPYRNLKLNVVYEIASGKIDGEIVKNFFKDGFLSGAKFVRRAYRQYVEAAAEVSLVKKLGVKTNLTTEETCFKDYLPEKLEVSAVKALNECRKNFRYSDADGSALNAALIRYAADLNKRAELKKSVLAVFTEEKLSDENLSELLVKAARKLTKYIETAAEAPKKTDFGANGILKKLYSYAISSKIKFTDMCRAVDDYNKYLAVREDMKEVCEEVKIALRAEISEKDITYLVRLYTVEDGKKEEFLSYADGIADSWDGIRSFIEKIGLSITETTDMGTLYSLRKGIGAISLLEEAMKSFGAENTIKNAQSVAVLYEICLALGIEGKESDVEEVSALCEAVKKGDLKFGFTENYLEFTKFAVARYEEKSYYNSPAVTVGDYLIFGKEITDRNMYGAYAGFLEIVEKSSEKIPLKKFFEPFVMGERKKGENPLDRIFEHSVYSALLYDRERLSDISELKQGRAERESVLNGILGKEKEIEKLNVEIITANCDSAIKLRKEEPIFNFLQSNKSIFATARSMFKQNPDAILALKRCFIMSPSTVSLLLRDDRYRFDVAIVDEASQIEPQYILPVILRVKQIIIVGDEYQMPPIEHFESSDTIVADREKSERQAETYVALKSVLDVTGANNSFDRKNLVCHFRSESEELIAYSLARYYKYMLTFPAVAPKKGSIGMRDVYTGEGFCEGGVNEEEAKKAVELIKDHFEKYYSEETKTLSRSVGVVVFGVKQEQCVRKLLDRDRELTKKIDYAVNNAGCAPEKVMFVRPIEKVQGQEIDDMILCITYGRKRDGSVTQAFGQLNRGELGEKIFNVAVSRAKKSVTVVHSVRFSDLSENASIGYIREYLKLSESYAEDTTGGFLTEENRYGFVDSVVKTLVDIGVPRGRIVVNYGVTENSLRIPIAILSEDKTEALIGLECEVPAPAGRWYIDHVLHYPEILKSRGWKLYNMYAYDWYVNRKAETELLKEILVSVGISETSSQ